MSITHYARLTVIMLLLSLSIISVTPSAHAQDGSPGLEAPTLTATPTSTGISLEWTAGPGADRHVLMYWTSREEGWVLIRDDLNRTKYNHEFLAPTNPTVLTAGRTYLDSLTFA